MRKRFKGTPEHVVNYFFFIAEEARQIMAEMGFTKLDDLIGQSELLDKSDMLEHWKGKGLDFSSIFYQPEAEKSATFHTEEQNHPIHDILDRKLIEASETGA